MKLSESICIEVEMINCRWRDGQEVLISVLCRDATWLLVTLSLSVCDLFSGLDGISGMTYLNEHRCSVIFISLEYSFKLISPEGYWPLPLH